MTFIIAIYPLKIQWIIFNFLILPVNYPFLITAFFIPHFFPGPDGPIPYVVD